VPLLSLALLGFNSSLIQWGDSIRGYGVGIIFILLTTGLVWRLLDRPTLTVVVAAVLSAICAVNCMLHNVVLLFAICAGALLVTWRRKSVQQAALVSLVGISAVASLLPYWGPLHLARRWDMIVRSFVTFGDLGQKFFDALASSGWLSGLIWLLLLAGLSGISLAALTRKKGSSLLRAQKDLLLWCGGGAAIGLVGYLLFLKILGYQTQAWYYLALMSFLALSFDIAFRSLQHIRGLRVAMLVVALLIAGTSGVATWKQVGVRQTNVDLVAGKLEGLAGADDLIVITPWFNGISFQRYYHGRAKWSSIPPIEFFAYHRYDLIKPKMVMADPVDPISHLLDQARETLKQGHKVWVAGRLYFPRESDPLISLSPAPNELTGWHDEPYLEMWATRFEVFLQVCSKNNGSVKVEPGVSVNPFENLQLRMFEGWMNR
jgi:hypothetical protein